MQEIVTYGPAVLLAYAAFLLSILSPGPNVLAIMGTSMEVSRRSGLALAMGVATGSLLWGTLTAMGLSALLASVAGALVALKVAGGLYLLWLAFKAFKAAAQDQDVRAQRLKDAPKSRAGYYRRGLLVQMTNPKALLAWIAIISIGLPADAPLWVPIAVVLGTTAFSVGIHALYALVFSSNPMVRVYAKARRWIQGALGLMFAGAGVKLLLSRS